MGNIFKVILLLVSCFFLIACSDEGVSNTEAKKEHVWKEQTDTINKAKEVEGIMMDAVENTSNAIKNQE
jgi:outer membrane biogenesis lipoprotein LolB